MKFIQINKSEKRLRLFENDSVVFDFKCEVGKNLGRKLEKNDNKTPQGEYKIIVKNPKSKYHLSLGLNYPNLEDVQTAFDSGIIDEKTRDKIISGHQNNFIPWDTKMGGEIYIHGDKQNNGTHGCITLENKDIKKMFNVVDVGTKVVIK